MYDIFLAYAKHEEEKNDIIERAAKAARDGCTEFTTTTDDYFSALEREEMRRAALRKGEIGW